MQKQISYKKIVICICAVAAVIAAAVIIVMATGREESYRSILVYELEGDVSIERADVGAMNAAQNLYLESGDRVSVAKDSWLRMKLDSDKYVMAEADTIFSVEAEGTEENSKTRICLEQGAVTNEIQNHLSESSQYETSTPNSVMAVRGTIYRAELFDDENGKQNMKICCFQGTVGTTPILPDGTFGEEVLVPAGSELTVDSEGNVDGPRNIGYEELPAQAIGFLNDLAQSGQTLTGISTDDLQTLTDEMQVAAEEEQAEISDLQTDSDEKEQNDQAEKNDQTQQAQSDKAAQSGRTAGLSDQSKASSSANKNSRKTGNAAKSGAQTDAAKPAQEAASVEQKAQSPAPAASASTGNVSAGTDSGQSGQGSGGSDSGSPANTGGSGSGNHDSDHTGGQGNSDWKAPDPSGESGNPVKPVEPVKPKYHTVTFSYQGKTFATKQVESGKTVTEPLLTPADSSGGYWDFDFGTKIEADTTVEWKANN